MTLTFYYAPFSTSNVTDAVLAELEHGRAEKIAERHKVSLKDSEQRTENYLTKVNPNGLVPALVHDGVQIWESAAITIYLGELFGTEGAEPLYPKPGPTRGEALKWIVWGNTHLSANAFAVHAAHGAKDEAAEEAAKKKVYENLEVLNKALDGKEYLLGDKYTLADTHVWSFVNWITMLEVKLDSVPNVAAWVKKIAAREQLKDI